MTLAEYLEREELLRQLRLWHMHRNDEMPDHFHYTGIKAWLEAMPAADVQPVKWISVAERLPEQNTRVIGFMAWKGITAIEYQHGKWYSIDHLQSLPNEAVTHWMPLPEPPKDGET